MRIRSSTILFVALALMFWSSPSQAQKPIYDFSVFKTMNVASTQFREISDGQNFHYLLNSMSYSIVFPKESDAIFMAQINLPDNSRIFSVTFHYFNGPDISPNNNKPHFYVTRAALDLPLDSVLIHITDTTIQSGLHKAKYSPIPSLFINNAQYLYFLVARIPIAQTGLLAATIRYR